MGTHALTRMWEDGKVLLVLYRQMDGYPTSHGAELKKALADGKSRIINGYSDQRVPGHFNGMGCLAAWLPGQIKGGHIGGIYVFPSSTREPEEWVYDLSSDDKGDLMLEVRYGMAKRFQDQQVVFSGRLADFDPDKTEGRVEQ